ncbi:MAG TPA: hypothetical protein VMU92_07500 [Acidobacteriaceae bacterium]|nr:hypothetical protein [Acidobacteriaceae bacterium]
MPAPIPQPEPIHPAGRYPQLLSSKELTTSFNKIKVLPPTAADFVQNQYLPQFTNEINNLTLNRKTSHPIESIIYTKLPNHPHTRNIPPATNSSSQPTAAAATAPRPWLLSNPEWLIPNPFSLLATGYWLLYP